MLLHTSTSHVGCHARKRPAAGQSLLAVLLQQLSRSEATEAGLDPRRRGLNGLLPLPHQEAANARLDLCRRLLLERLPSILSLQQMLLRLCMFLLQLIPLVILLIRLLLMTTLREFLQLLTHAVPTEVGLDLRCRRVGLHCVGVLLRGLRHERSSEPVTQSFVSRSLKSVRSEFSKLSHEGRETSQKLGFPPDYLRRSWRGSRTSGLFTKINSKSVKYFKLLLLLIICKDRKYRHIREFPLAIYQNRILSGKLNKERQRFPRYFQKYISRRKRGILQAG